MRKPRIADYRQREGILDRFMQGGDGHGPEGRGAARRSQGPACQAKGSEKSIIR